MPRRESIPKRQLAVRVSSEPVLSEQAKQELRLLLATLNQSLSDVDLDGFIRSTEGLLEKYRFDMKASPGDPNPGRSVRRVRDAARELVDAIEYLSSSADLFIQRSMAKAVEFGDVPDYRVTTPQTLKGMARSMIEAADRALANLPAKPKSERHWKPAVQDLLLGLANVWQQASGKHFTDASYPYNRGTGPHFVESTISLAGFDIGKGQLQKRLPRVRDALKTRPLS